MITSSGTGFFRKLDHLKRYVKIKCDFDHFGIFVLSSVPADDTLKRTESVDLAQVELNLPFAAQSAPGYWERVRFRKVENDGSL